MNRIYTILRFLIFSIAVLLTQSGTSQTQFRAPQETLEFKFTTWNVEWLSCTTDGPTNENLQLNNVALVIKSMNSDVVALQEVGTSTTYATINLLLQALGNEWGGEIVTSWLDNCEQNQAIIYKKAKIQFISGAFITDGGGSYDWSSGRYPVLYSINLKVGGEVVPVSLINIHAKAMSDASSYTRRKNASLGLKTLLDGSAYNTKKIILLGDFNDYLVGTQCSTCSPADSPYKNFVEDTQNYKCLTNGLYDPNYRSPVIDNIIISNELIDNYTSSSTAREELATQSIPSYTTTTSDHTPISAKFNITAGAPTNNCTNLSVSETFATSLGNFTPYSVDGLQTWGWQQYYGATVTGYASAVNNANEDWLISPVYDLTGRSSATLTFSHALNYAPLESNRINNHTLWISTNYSNNTAPSSATWTQLAIPTIPPGVNWTFLNSGNINIPSDKLTNNVRFALKYISTTAAASTWEVKNFTLNATCPTTSTPATIAIAQSKIYVANGYIRIENNQPLQVVIYDITGRVLFTAKEAQKIEIPAYNKGIYIVRAGNKTTKIIIE